MSEIQIKKVESRRDKRLFLTFPWQIYENDPLWVPPLLKDRYTAIDPARGVFFERGTAEFFNAWQDGNLVGTICTAIDFKANKNNSKQECVFGFFESINEQAVADALFDHAAAWAKEHDLNSLYGPFNLDYEDSYGILVEGRERPPAIMCGHTPVYYQHLVENYGFKPGRAMNLAFYRSLNEDLEKLRQVSRFAKRVKERRNFSIRHADFSRWEEEVDRVYHLINIALAHLPGHTPWQPEALRELMAPFVKIADPELILFAEHEGKTIGFFPALPNFNEILIHANGLRRPWDAIRAWRYSKKPIRSASVKSVLMLPEYWGSGAAILMFSEMAERLIEKGYKWVDLSLTSEDNPKTPQLAERINAKVYKKYQVYHFQF